VATKIVGSKTEAPSTGNKRKPGSHHTSREPKVARRGAPATQSWATFTNALAGVLRVLRDDQFLILQHMRSRYFVQFAADGRTGLRAEAVSNTYLSRKKKLDDTKMAKLQRWAGTARAKRNQSPNFYRDWNKATESSARQISPSSRCGGYLALRAPPSWSIGPFAVKGGEILLPRSGSTRNEERRRSRNPRENLLQRLSHREKSSSQKSPRP